MELIDGSNIAVIGGGPAGSFFSFLAITNANSRSLNINIDIFEAKDFNCSGPSGCNNCGGIVSESLIQILSEEGIILPTEVVRKGIETYKLHLEQGNAVIEASTDDQRIASMFRGIGPTGCKPNKRSSFDNYMLDLSVSKGANIIHERVTDLERKDNGILIKTNNNFEKEYDLVVGAVGLNKKTLSLFQKLCHSLIVPRTTQTYIREFQVDSKLIDENFGNSMHVFLLNIPNIKFGAIIPKANYVTLILLGSNINKELIERFIHSESVKNCFPVNFDLNKAVSCSCYPYINIEGAKNAYDDRIVLIGDSATSKLYKDGIGAAYITAKSAANTSIFHGISKNHFKKYFQPTCTRLKRDNNIGKFIFNLTSILQKSEVLKSALLKVVIDEQKKPRDNRNLSSVLWDTFTGNVPYKNILLRLFNPKLIISLIQNIIHRKSIKEVNPITSKTHPRRSRNILTDVKYFLIDRSPIDTLVKFDTEKKKQRFYESVLQRIGIDVDNYKMFNIHKIGIDAPASYLIDDLLKWNGDSSCWPNHIARVNLIGNKLEKIKIVLFGRAKPLFGKRKGIFGYSLLHLFDLNAIKIQKTPAQNDPDNARYLLYECKGGYPIGVFSMYVRSSIPELGEKEMSQLFIMVSFDFFGKSWISKIKIIRKIWAFFHNRVTSMVAYRFKQLCEWRLEKLKVGN